MKCREARDFNGLSRSAGMKRRKGDALLDDLLATYPSQRMVANCKIEH